MSQFPSYDVPTYRAPESVRPFVIAARAICFVLAGANAANIVGMVIAPRALSGGDFYIIYMALLATTGAFFGVLGSLSRAQARPRVFANMAMSMAVLQGIFLIPFVLSAIPGLPRSTPLLILRCVFFALTVISITVFGLISRRDATHHLAIQTAHRAVSLGFWVLVGKLILDIWGRPISQAILILPAAFGLFSIGVLASIIVYWTSRDRLESQAESRGLFMISTFFVVATLFWMAMGILAAR